MDFTLSQEQEAFRNEVREFVKKDYPPEWRKRGKSLLNFFLEALTDSDSERNRTLAQKLGAKGWLSIAWPKEYGGQNSPLLQLILAEELLYNECPGIISSRETLVYQ